MKSLDLEVMFRDTQGCHIFLSDQVIISLSKYTIELLPMTDSSGDLSFAMLRSRFQYSLESDHTLISYVAAPLSLCLSLLFQRRNSTIQIATSKAIVAEQPLSR